MSTPPERRFFIDEQASYDLGCGALAEGHTWEALRDAVQRCEDFWPHLRLLAAPSTYGVSLA
jgi:hypothetical protein